MAAARAGYSVAAFDIFNDVDTRRCCFHSAQVRFSDGGFAAEDLLRCLGEIDLSSTDILYGSGLEGQPELLERISSRYRLLGNTADTVSTVKSPDLFFGLLDDLDIRYPETIYERPADSAGWLSKSAAGSGGTHIRRSDARPGDYYQREVQGLPVSLLFLADGRNVEPVGFNEQFLSPVGAMPFRFGGAASNAELPEKAMAAMTEAAKKITVASNLCGLNSMDFVLVDQEPLALEINPRLSASFELYDIPDLLERHMQASCGLLTTLPARPQGSIARLIYYARHDLTMPEMAMWPEWVTDIFPAGSQVRVGEPVCSVLANAPNANQAKTLAFARARQLDAQCHSFKI